MLEGNAADMATGSDDTIFIGDVRLSAVKQVRLPRQHSTLKVHPTLCFPCNTNNQTISVPLIPSPSLHSQNVISTRLGDGVSDTHFSFP
jgi:hypothetical protein